MNTPSPLIPQGTSPDRDKSGFFFKFLMIVAFHVVVIGGMLLQGCRGTKTNPDVTQSDLTSSSNSDLTSLPPLTNPPPSGMSGSNGLGSLPTPLGGSNLGAQPLPYTPPLPPPPPKPETKEYTVVRGDIPVNIAKKNGVSLKALMDANPGLDARKLKVGAKLEIPTSAASPTATAMADTGESATYTVKSGDNLTRIAKAHGTTVKKLQELNDLKTTGIKAGQKLKVPAKAGDAGLPAMTTVPATAPAPAPLPPMQLSATPQTAPTAPPPGPMTR